MEASRLPLPAPRAPLRVRRGRWWVDRCTSVACLAVVAALAALAVAKIAGYSVLIDRSDSMQPTIAAGDLIVTDRQRAEDVRRGDVVTFPDPSRSGESVTHRVVHARHRDSALHFVTRGDASSGVERWSSAPSETLGRFVLTIPRLGYVVSWFTAPGVRLALILLAGAALATAVVQRRGPLR